MNGSRPGCAGLQRSARRPSAELLPGLGAAWGFEEVEHGGFRGGLRAEALALHLAPAPMTV